MLICVRCNSGWDTGHGIDEALFDALAKSAAARESKRDFRLGKSFVRLPMELLTDAHFFFLALAYVGTERRNPIFSFVNCPCDQEIDLVLSIPRARICIHLVPLSNVFFDRDKKRKRIRQLTRKTQPPDTLFDQA
jgi:hypothetical protein